MPDEAPITLSQDDKTMLVNTINKKGFFLEEKAYKILEQRHFNFLSKNFIPKNYNLTFPDKRVEIDLVFVEDNKNLVIECKKTDFAWLFPKSLVGSNNKNYIYEHDPPMNMKVRSYPETKWKVCYSEPMPFMIDENGALIPQNNEGQFVKTQPRQEDPIQRAILQVLYQTKALRWEPESKKPFSFFIPIILTNAPLYYMDYEAIQIDNNSNLMDYNSLEKVKAIIYNYSEILNWPNAIDEGRIKSVFIVNINHFNEFLDWVWEEELANLEGFRGIKKSKPL